MSSKPRIISYYFLKEQREGNDNLRPRIDDNGDPIVYFDRICFAMNKADNAARATFFAHMRSLSIEDYRAGRGVTFITEVRDDVRFPARPCKFVFGGHPRKERTYAEMEAEALSVIKATHKVFYAQPR